jgi:hypothetical protein
MARTPIDDNLFIDSWWRLRSKNGRTAILIARPQRVRIVQIHRKDKSVQYETDARPGLKLEMKIAYLRENYEPETIYINV